MLGTTPSHRQAPTRHRDTGPLRHGLRHSNTPAHTNKYKHRCAHTDTFLCRHRYTHTYTHACTNTHICTQTHLQTHVHKTLTDMYVHLHTQNTHWDPLVHTQPGLRAGGGTADLGPQLPPPSSHSPQAGRGRPRPLPSRPSPGRREIAGLPPTLPGCHPPSQARSPLFPHPEGGQCAWGAPSHRVLQALIVRTHLGP